ncbi:Alpha-amylase [Trebouxia sp. C0010 RCD-2024]
MNVSVPSTSATSGLISEPRRVASAVFHRPTRCWGLCFLPNGCPRLQLGSTKQLVAVQHRHKSRICTPQAGVWAAAATVSAEASSSNLSSQPLQIDFDNEGDPDVTLVSVSGPDQRDLLMQLTGAFNSMQLVVVAASIVTTEDGRVRDVFKVTDQQQQKIPEKHWEAVKTQLLTLISKSSRSSQPQIFGAAPAAPVQKQRQSAGQMQGSASALETAAAEMGQAAASLVAIERQIVELTEQGAEASALTEVEVKRAEAAALLERRMAAMEAVLAARRSPPAQTPEPQAARGPGADLRFMAGGATSSGPAAGSGFEMILQGFNWESYRNNWYKTLQEQIPAIAEAGFTAIWLPPPSDAVSAQGYLPRDYYNLDSKYGSEAELRELISVMHENGIKAIADIVINHRCAHFQEDGKWNKFGGRLAWDKSYICNNNPSFGGTGSHKPQEDYVAAPNLDHSQERVRKDITAWMKWLRNNVGYDGWRFDFVKGYAGEAVREYINATVPTMAFGEYWDTCEYTDGVLNYNQDTHRQRTVNWCDKTGGTAAAFDFTTKGILQEAMGRGEYWRLVDGQGRPPGLMGMWPSRAVTFIENHDTGSTLNHWPFPWNHLGEAHAYQLTHCGTPCVFYDHFMNADLQKHIKALLKIRKRHGISNRSKVLVHKATNDVYAASIDKKIAVKVGPGNWSPQDGGVQIGQKDWTLATSGPNFAVWDAVF